ncbi:MerR family transcriptional regulator [Geomicrobium sp. JSM 1781026]|uniref:MerR family transcriptional regulator n=1 Tax=Geomicrobium sp. JSM 1781026 TaxID=3344580 RepID=UPI0035C123EA
MYSIGLFSKMNRVTVKALRYYDKVGILKPAHVDAATGYRYYKSTQIGDLHHIMALRQIGFTIAEIEETLAHQSATELIEEKRGQLLGEMEALKAQLAQTEYYLSKAQTPDIFIKSLPAVTVASMRLRIANYDALFQVVPEMGERMRAAGCRLDPLLYCFQMYHDPEHRVENIDVEICEAVTEKKPDANGLVFKQVPEVGTAACLLHRGPYSTIGETHVALYDWLEHNRYELAGPPREAVIDGIWNQEYERHWLTEVQFPLKATHSH